MKWIFYVKQRKDSLERRTNGTRFLWYTRSRFIYIHNMKISYTQSRKGSKGAGERPKGSGKWNTRESWTMCGMKTEGELFGSVDETSKSEGIGWERMVGGYN